MTVLRSNTLSFLIALMPIMMLIPTTANSAFAAGGSTEAGASLSATEARPGDSARSEMTSDRNRSRQISWNSDAVARFLMANEQQSTPALSSESSPATAQDGTTGVLFGVYPGGGNGELGYVEPPSADTVLSLLNELRGEQAFDVRLYTAWSWYNERALDDEIQQYTSAGMYVTLTVKYSPPAGHEGDVEGFAGFVRQVVARHGANPLVHRFVIGNEINVINGNPGSSDGPFASASEATIAGVLAAREQLESLNSAAQVGISMAVLERETDAQFLQHLAALGGGDFTASVAFLGLNVYPGMWPVGTGDPYADMVTHLLNGRYSLTSAGFGESVGLAILENGYPTADAALQIDKLDGFVRAVCDTASAAGVTSYSWFGLWDANSNSDSPYAHYGLLRSDMTAKPSFDLYRTTIANACGE